MEKTNYTLEGEIKVGDEFVWMTHDPKFRYMVKICDINESAYTSEAMIDFVNSVGKEFNNVPEIEFRARAHRIDHVKREMR